MVVVNREANSVSVIRVKNAQGSDVANKIGTYSVAVLAHAHDIPFYVGAPTSSIDLAIETGAEIPIEERDPDEVLTFAGVRVALCGLW